MRYVAFLRAINTGNRRIKMADLRSLYTGLGYDDVATYIASGNVILDAGEVPDVRRLEDAFEDAFGFASEVFLRDADEISVMLAGIPWSDADGVVEVSFLRESPDPEAARDLEATAVPPEALIVTGAEVVFLREGKGIQTMHKESTSERILGMTMSRRGLATVQAIRDRFLTETSNRSDA